MRAQKPSIINFNDIAWTPHPTLPGIDTKFVKHEVEFSPSDMVIAQVNQAGEIPWHVHESESEIAYVLQGQGTLYCSETESRDTVTETPIKAGVALVVPPGLWHSVTNTGDETMLILACHTP